MAKQILDTPKDESADDLEAGVQWLNRSRGTHALSKTLTNLALKSATEMNQRARQALDLGLGKFDESDLKSGIADDLRDIAEDYARAVALARQERDDINRNFEEEDSRSRAAAAKAEAAKAEAERQRQQSATSSQVPRVGSGPGAGGFYGSSSSGSATPSQVPWCALEGPMYGASGGLCACPQPADQYVTHRCGTLRSWMYDSSGNKVPHRF